MTWLYSHFSYLLLYLVLHNFFCCITSKHKHTLAFKIISGPWTNAVCTCARVVCTVCEISVRKVCECSKALFPIMQAIFHVLSETANVWGQWRLEFAIHGLDLGFVRADINNLPLPSSPCNTTSIQMATGWFCVVCMSEREQRKSTKIKSGSKLDNNDLIRRKGKEGDLEWIVQSNEL